MYDVTIGETMSDVIIILARGVEQDGSLPPDPMARVQKGVELFKANVAPVIIMSGSWTYHLDISPSRTEAAAMKEYAVSLGVPETAIIEETKSKDTLGNAYFSKSGFCEPRGWHNIVVVTSEDHLQRSQYIFTKVFGSDYTIIYEVSERVILEDQYEKELKHEVRSMAILKQWLGGLSDGDDTAIWQLMSTKHPAYATNPEVSREELLKALDGEDIFPDAP